MSENPRVDFFDTNTVQVLEISWNFIDAPGKLNLIGRKGWPSS